MPLSTLSRSDDLRVYDNILEAIGKTPLIRLNRVGRSSPCPIYGKLEFLNPGGSVKDRIGITMINEAERAGRLKPGGTVVESTSGNTGVGLAIACAIKGYKAVFVMPDKMSQEKIQLLRAFGAKVVITPTAVAPEDPRSYYSVADRIVAETPNAILANQYHNPENPLSHYLTTGPEIWEQTQGQGDRYGGRHGNRRHNNRCWSIFKGTKPRGAHGRGRPNRIDPAGNLAAGTDPG